MRRIRPILVQADFHGTRYTPESTVQMGTAGIVQPDIVHVDRYPGRYFVKGDCRVSGRTRIDGRYFLLTAKFGKYYGDVVRDYLPADFT